MKSMFNNLIHQVEAGASPRMITRLRQGFPLTPRLEEAICDDQQCHEIEHALQHWLQMLLLSPDPQFGMLLMPTIRQRFDEYLTQLRRSQPWN